MEGVNRNEVLEVRHSAHVAHQIQTNLHWLLTAMGAVRFLFLLYSLVTERWAQEERRERLAGPDRNESLDVRRPFLFPALISRAVVMTGTSRHAQPRGRSMAGEA